jgi:hypothetical protein
LRAQWQQEKEDAVVEDEATMPRKDAVTPTPKSSNATRAKLPGQATDSPSVAEKGGASADDPKSGNQLPREAQDRLQLLREAQDRLPGVRSSNVTQFALREARKPIAGAAASSNRVLEELRDLEPRFRDQPCPQCDRTEHLAITNEGIVVACKECKQSRRVDTDTLQRLADRLAATCFSCTSGKLKSIARSYGNILICQNPGCTRNNYWQRLSERIRR